MTFEHNNPDVVCDKCYVRADTVYDGDRFRVEDHGWYENNVNYPISNATKSHRMREDIDAALRAEKYEHLCYECMESKGFDLEGEWPMFEISFPYSRVVRGSEN